MRQPLFFKFWFEGKICSYINVGACIARPHICTIADDLEYLYFVGVMNGYIVGTGVLDGNPQKLTSSLSGNPYDCPRTETICRYNT